MMRFAVLLPHPCRDPRTEAHLRRARERAGCAHGRSELFPEFAASSHETGRIQKTRRKYVARCRVSRNAGHAAFSARLQAMVAVGVDPGIHRSPAECGRIRTIRTPTVARRPGDTQATGNSCI